MPRSSWRRLLLLVAAVLGVTLTTLAPAHADPLPSQEASVVVYDAATDEPVAGINVALWWWTGDGWAQTDIGGVTDENGEATAAASGEQDGWWYLAFTDPAERYAPNYGIPGDTPPSGPGDDGTHFYGGTFDPVEVVTYLNPNDSEPSVRSISGSVRGAGGYLDNIEVTAYPVGGLDGDPVASSITYGGEYWLEVPDRDSYILHFVPLDGLPYREFTLTDPITILGEDYWVDDVWLYAPTDPRITGTLTGPDDVPIDRASVRVFEWNEGAWYETSAVTRTNSGGEFTLYAQEGSVVALQAAARGFRAAYLGSGATPPADPESPGAIVAESGADVDLGTFKLEARPDDLGRVAGQNFDYCRANTLPRNDDNSSEAVDIPFPLTFFGQPYDHLYVNNNGNVTFNSASWAYSPEDLTGDRGEKGPIIAPFFADVDTRGEASFEATYGASPDKKSFCVNWSNVGYYGSHDDKLNTFQLILTENSTGAGRVEGDFDITFNYDRIEWETGDADNGEGGLGGSPSATVGFSAGTGVPGTFFQMPGSLVNGALLDGGPNALISGFQGSITPGRYMFPVRNADIEVTLGPLDGAVTDSSEAAVAGAYVQACLEDSSSCQTTLTNTHGRFMFSALRAGNYAVSVSPPSGSSLFPAATTAEVIVSQDPGFDPEDVLVTLQAPQPLPSGVSLTNADPTFGEIWVPEDGTPVVHYQSDLVLEFDGCEGVEDPEVVETLGGNVTFSGAMVEDPAGHYTVTVPASYPAHGQGTISTNVPQTCGGENVEFNIYIDPSGVVTDQWGQPIDGAEVTLMRADTEGGPYTAVPDGSAVMSPSNRTNPDTTDAVGFFQWDVLAGWYRVDTSADDCTDTSSARMEVPPARLDLLIKMTCDAAGAPLPTTTPTVTGTRQVGQTLTATPGAWGSGLVHRRVEWVRGATIVQTGASYTPTAGDAGQNLVVRFVAKRPDYTQENGAGDVVTFAEATFETTTGTVAAAPGGGGGGGGGGATAPVNTEAPKVTGTAKVGQLLTAHPGTWNTTGLTYAYQWLRDGDQIADATGQEYTAKVADLGKAIRVKVTASKSGLPAGAATSEAVTVAEGDAPKALAPPAITGEPQPGQQLHVSTGSWDVDSLTFSYQWLRDGTPIQSATSSAYTVTEADQGHELSARVTAARDGFVNGTVLTQAITVPDASVAEPATTTTKAKLLKSTVKAGKRAQLRVTVTRADGETAGGKFEVWVDGKRKLTERLTAADDGVTVVKLPKVGVGNHKVQVRYLGTSTAKPSRSEVVKLTIKQKHKHARDRARSNTGAPLPASQAKLATLVRHGLI